MHRIISNFQSPTPTVLLLSIQILKYTIHFKTCHAMPILTKPTLLDKEKKLGKREKIFHLFISFVTIE
jgi:hypothetical protein